MTLELGIFYDGFHQVKSHIVKCSGLGMIQAAIALITGCAAVQPLPELVEIKRVDKMTIQWVRGVKENCGGALSPLGCAETFDGGRCTITTPSNAPDEVLGHEFRHCFGYSHKR